MGSELEQLTGVDPHVEISREELELGLPSPIIYNALSEVEEFGYRINTPTVIGADNSKFFGTGPNGSIRASSSSATELQQAEMAPAAFDPGSHADIMSWPQLSINEDSLKGTGGQSDLGPTFNLNLRADEIQQLETAILHHPSNSVAAPYSILPLTNLSDYGHETSEEPSREISRRGKDAPRCTESEDFMNEGKVLATATKPGNYSDDIPLQKEESLPGSVERPNVTPNLSSSHRELSNGIVCAERDYSGPTETAQRLQSEIEDPDFESSVMPTSFFGLFQSILASDSPSSQLVETGIKSNGPTAASSTVTSVSNRELTNMVNTTTSLMLASLNQPCTIPEPPGLLQFEHTRKSRSRVTPSTAVAALDDRPAFLPIQRASRTSYREARVESAATTVSAAASAARSAVQAAEASIEALANLGINNGSLYQGRNSFLYPQPLKVLSGGRPVDAGVNGTFQDPEPPIFEQPRGMNATGILDLIRVGSTVEVMPAEDGLQTGWFIAKVLSMTSKEALVEYYDLMADDGRSHVKESFPLHCSRDENSFGTTVLAAQGWIRPVHPFSSSQKRGHCLTVYENWVVGDRVDAFVEDGWWEAIIQALNEADETKISVFFPGDGSRAVVRAWTVRPSLVWTNGEWNPCRGDSVEQDYPPPKRQKTSSVRRKGERTQTKTKVAAAANPERAHKKTPDLSQTKRSRASGHDHKSLVVYSEERDSGQSFVTPTRVLRSATRSNGNVAQTKVPSKSSITPVPKARIANARATPSGVSPLSRSQQLEVAVTPELGWGVRRQSSRLQQKEVSPNPHDLEMTPSKRSQYRKVAETGGRNDLALVLLPEPRLRTRSQKVAPTKS